jgi:hypothetical protein
VEVVTFDVRGGDPELRRASADLGDALVRVLTRSGIDTVPKISVRGDGGPDVAELRVTGSIGRQGRDIVVDTQVLDRKTGLVLSSLQLTRPANAAAGFTDKIAVDVAAGLDCALEDRKRSRRAMDPTVFALYLNTCDSIVREGNAPRMLDSGRRLVEAAPRLAIGQALYAVAQAMSAKDLKHQPAEAAALQHGARASAALALTLDPQTPKAYLAIANSYPEGTNWAERERNLLKARQIDPNLNPGRMSYVTLLREVGRLDEALEVSQQLVASDDPRTLGYAEVPAILVSAQLGQMRSAHAFLEQLDRFDPDMARSVRWEVSSSWTVPAAALADLRAFGPQGQDPRTFACVQQFLGELPTRVAAHVRGLPAACGGLPPERRVTMLAREGDVDGAYAEFAKVASEHAFLGFLFEPEMKSFRADARFMPLAARLGLTDYWMTSGHWPDFCAEPGLPYDCRAAAQALEAGSRT